MVRERIIYLNFPKWSGKITGADDDVVKMCKLAITYVIFGRMLLSKGRARVIYLMAEAKGS